MMATLSDSLLSDWLFFSDVSHLLHIRSQLDTAHIHLELQSNLNKIAWRKIVGSFQTNLLVLGNSSHSYWTDEIKCCHRVNFELRKVASSRLSRLVAHFQIFKRYMKGKIDAYVLLPLAKKFQNWIVDRSTALDFTVFGLDSGLKFISV